MNYGLVLIGALMVVFALFYFRAAESENAPAFLWAGLSIAMSLLCWRVLRFGWLGICLGQVVLFFGITAVRALRKN